MSDVIGGALAISASGLRAERLRLDAIASNLANASTTRTPEGGPYKRRNVIFAAQGMESDFAATIASMGEDGARRGVAVTDVTVDESPPRMVFDPGHPDANGVTEIAGLISRMPRRTMLLPVVAITANGEPTPASVIVTT